MARAPLRPAGRPAYGHARSSLTCWYEIRAEGARLGLGSFVLQATNAQGMDLHTDGEMCTNYLNKLNETA